MQQLAVGIPKTVHQGYICLETYARKCMLWPSTAGENHFFYPRMPLLANVVSGSYIEAHICADLVYIVQQAGYRAFGDEMMYHYPDRLPSGVSATGPRGGT